METIRVWYLFLIVDHGLQMQQSCHAMARAFNANGISGENPDFSRVVGKVILGYITYLFGGELGRLQMLGLLELL